ncbi:dihydrolipoamide acetyltransferase family protein [Actinoplanes sp. NPDC049548]|uniref:dihydrolipoamide acetyltransferase family protein n=1 Tax=Actinoplanes sp. NPDC049548 TaxID=3155152 RepID=UPI00341A005E
MSGDQVFRLPDLGEGLTEAEIVQWHVAVGDTVTIDQAVVEVETAKAVVEVPVPYAGTVSVLHAEPGSVVAVGAPLISVASGSGNVLIGYGTGHAPAARRRRIRRAAAVTAPVSREPGAARVISPLVRKLARDNGVDLATVTPDPAHGVIRRRDVEDAIAAARPVAAERVSAGSPPGERIPLRGVRRAVADKLTRSRTEIPDATTWVDADATGLIEAKNALASRGVSLLALLARICVAGLRRFPELNATVDTAAGEIVRLPYVNLGFAAQTDRGLMVPVVQGAHLMSTAQLGAEVSRLAGLARAGTLPPAAMTGGTFTLNNYGVFGVDGSNAIINHPEAGILGVGRIVDKPWVVDGQLAVRKVTQLSLSFDHRVCDGGAAGGFLRYVADCVEQPATLLADL